MVADAASVGDVLEDQRTRSEYQAHQPQDHMALTERRREGRQDMAMSRTRPPLDSRA